MPEQNIDNVQGYIEDTIQEIQGINLKILKEIDRVCKENGIQYFLDSGSLIGAVRSGEMIPWDDDADVVFMRQDYEKLINLPKEAWGEDFRFVAYDGYGKDVFFDCLSHVYYLPKKIRGGKRMLEKIQDVCDKDILDCIAVDMFTVDGTHDSAFLHKFKVIRWYMCYGMMMGHRPKLDFSEYSGFPKVVIIVMSFIGKLFPLSWLYRHYKHICTCNENTEHLFYSNITLPKAIKKHLKREWWGDGAIEGTLCQETFSIPKRYHDILTYEYGDYMTPPPDSEKIPEHFIAVQESMGADGE